MRHRQGCSVLVMACAFLAFWIMLANQATSMYMKVCQPAYGLFAWCYVKVKVSDPWIFNIKGL